MKAVDGYGKDSITGMLEANLVSYLDWGFLNIGAFKNVSIPTSGILGGSGHVLNKLSDTRYQGYHMNWVWQSGVAYTPQPIGVSVFVDGSPASGHYIDYPKGRVTFNVPQSGVITASYAHKLVNVVGMSHPTSRALYDSLNYASHHFSQVGSGNWATEQRIELPTIVVHPLQSRNSRGYQLGGGLTVTTDVVLHVFAQTHGEAAKVLDILSLQDRFSLPCFDSYSVAQSGHMPLNYRGECTCPTCNHAYLVQQHYRQSIYIRDTRISNVRRVNDKLSYGSATLTIEVDVPDA